MATLLLTILLTISIFLLSFIWSIRQRTVHEFRMADVNFFAYSKLASKTCDQMLANAYTEIAKEWLKVSEEYRGTAIYSTFQLAYFAGGVMLALVAVFIDLLFHESLNWLILAGPILVTLSLGFMPLLSRYGMVKMDFFEKPTSLAIGALWPPLLSHLARWNEINAEIRSKCEYLDFMKNVSHHDDIVRILGYVETSET